MEKQVDTAFNNVEYWDKRYSSIDISKSGHIDLPVEYNEWLYRTKKKCLLDALRRVGFSAAGKSVLDIAPGTGIYTALWESCGVSKLTGIDLSANAVASLKSRFPRYAFHQGDLGDPNLMDLLDSPVDLVTAIDMLYHVVDEARFDTAISNLSKALKPGGYLAVHDHFAKESIRDFGYIKLRPLQRYLDALGDNGFELVWKQPTFFLSVQCQPFEPQWLPGMLASIWTNFTYPVIRRSPGTAGAMTHYADRVLMGLLSRGPSFQLMICRKKS